MCCSNESLVAPLAKGLANLGTPQQSFKVFWGMAAMATTATTALTSLLET